MERDRSKLHHGHIRVEPTTGLRSLDDNDVTHNPRIEIGCNGVDPFALPLDRRSKRSTHDDIKIVVAGIHL